MATCKECLHYEACVLNEAYWVKHNADQACSVFKDKSKYVEQKQGHWIYETVEFSYEKDIKCSACNLYVEHTSIYCPNCGAKMDGGYKND